MRNEFRRAMYSLTCVDDHSKYFLLKSGSDSRCLIFSGMEFQIFDPE